MKDLEQRKSWYSNIDLEQRKNWYSTVADAYNKARPRYSKDLIHRAVELAQLPSQATILELGCGPGIATVTFARVGFSMLCLEPSQELCQIARENCAQYPNVEIRNTTFEECELEAESFNAVLAATSFNWISPEVGYTKAAGVLQDKGALILLWNTAAQPQYEVYQVLDEVYKRHAPSVGRYESRETQQESLRSFVQSVMDSGQFKDLVSEQIVCEFTYSINDYLALLSTYSPYLELNPQSRDSLFEGLREKIEQNFGGSIQLSYLCAFHLARKY
jgi:ubiquinone/menaquinone biosynthesis C-methylase UbiE